MTDPLDWIDQELAQLAARSLLREREVSAPLPQGKCLRAGRLCWNFASNDYLGLSEHPAVLSAAQEALSTGIGAKASPLVTGRTPLHAELERELARFKQTAAAVLFPTGFAANVGVLSALLGPEDAVFSDRLNHASLIDGARATGARFRVYPHLDLAALERDLRKTTGFRRRVIATDAVFSMDGDVAPLRELADLAEEHAAILVVDEAHATGVFGTAGSGLLEAQGVHAEQVVSVGTLSKGIGVQGGFVAGSQRLCDWIWNRARTLIYSTALAPPVCAGALAALKIIREEPERRAWLFEASQLVQSALRQQGWVLPAGLCGPILPVLVGNSAETMRLAGLLREQGLLVAAIRPPTVPRETARLRISLSYAHGTAGTDALLEAFERLSRERKS